VTKVSVFPQATGGDARRSKSPQMLRRALVSAVLPLAVGCTAPSEEVRPPDDGFDFPTGVAVSPDEANLFVLSANSELRYDSGTVQVIDLVDADQVIADWLADGTIPENCDPDPTFSETLACDAPRFLRPGAGVRIGNFATSLAVQDKGGGDLRLVVPVRGDPSITTIDWSGDAGVLECGDAEGFPLCDDDHRLSRFLDDPDLPQISEEPYHAFVDSFGEWAMVTHLTSGSVTLVDLPAAGDPMLSDVLGGLFAADPSGRRGSLGIAGRTPGQEGDIVYVGSLSENRIQTFTVARTALGRPLLVPGEYFFLDEVGGDLGGGSSDTRAIVFGQGGDVGYFMNREPPTVAVVDTSIDTTGVPVADVVRRVLEVIEAERR